MQHLDRQLRAYKDQLITEVRLSSQETSKVATLVASEVRFLPSSAKERIAASSPIPISARLDELRAFQSWMDWASQAKGRPEVTRAQVITQNYVCFVYLKDALFQALLNNTSSDSVTARCAQFLSKSSVRSFRNAVAHANWCYKPDFSGLQCWVLKDARNPDQGMRYFEVSQKDIDFWQSLARGVAYAAYTQLDG
jgi:hypothetical protein